jgi:hypothetical protein
MLTDAGGNLSIYGSVNALDDAEIWADGRIELNAAVAAVDDIKIRTCGDLTIKAFAPLSVGDVLVASIVSAGDELDACADEDLLISAATGFSDGARWRDGMFRLPVRQSEMTPLGCIKTQMLIVC